MAEVTDKLIDTVEVARGFAGTLRNSAGIRTIPDSYNVYYDPLTDTYPNFLQPYRTGFFPEFEYIWAGITVKVWMDTIRTEIMEIPDPYFEAGDLAFHQELWLYAEVTEPGGTHSFSHKLEETDVAWIDQVAVWNAAVGINLEIGGDFERRASWSLASPSALVASQIATHYPDHYSPHGMPSPTVQCYYRPPDDGLTIDLELTYDSSTVISYSDTYIYEDLGYASLAAYREAFDVIEDDTYIGLPSFILNIDCVKGSDGQWNGEASAVTALSGSLLGAGSNDYEFDLLGSASSRWKCEDGGISFITYGVLSWLFGGITYDSFECAASLTGKAGGYEVSHGGSVTHLDGDGVEGAVIAVDDVSGFGDTTDANGAFSASKTYLGLWSASMTAADPYDFDSTDPSYDGDYYIMSDSESDTLTSHGSTITNCSSLAEPYFPVEGETSTEWLGFSDNSMLHQELSGAYAWNAAVTFSALASLRVVDWIASHTGWSITGGSADISVDTDGALKLTNISGAPVLTADLSAMCWAGARLLEVLYSSDDTAALTLTAGEGEWFITPSAYTVDVLQPTNRDGFAHTPAVLGNAWPWQYGIDSPGVVQISGFRAGKTYSFKHIDLRRLTAEQNGGIQVVIFPQGAFVGDEIKHARTSDLYLAGGEEHGGLVIIDGVVAAELTTTTRTPIGSVSWDIDGVLLGDSLFCRPAGGLLQLTIPDSDVSAAWLGGGFHSGYSSVTVGGRLYVRTTVAPATWGDISVGYSKRMRGIAIIRLPEGGVQSLVIRRHWGDKLIDWETVQTNADGVCYTPALQQPTCERVTVGPGANLGQVTISGLSQPASYYEDLPIYIRGSDTSNQLRVISGISGGVATLTTQLLSAPSSGSIGYIQLPISYHIELEGNDLLCSESTGELLHHPTTGELLYGGGLGGDFESRNHGVEYILIKKT